MDELFTILVAELLVYILYCIVKNELKKRNDKEENEYCKEEAQLLVQNFHTANIEAERAIAASDILNRKKHIWLRSWFRDPIAREKVFQINTSLRFIEVTKKQLHSKLKSISENIFEHEGIRCAILLAYPVLYKEKLKVY